MMTMGDKMSFESDVNQSVRQIVDHIKLSCSRNLIDAVVQGKLTLDREKLPGLQLLVTTSIENAYRQSTEGLNGTLRQYTDKVK